MRCASPRRALRDAEVTDGTSGCGKSFPERSDRLPSSSLRGRSRVERPSKPAESLRRDMRSASLGVDRAARSASSPSNYRESCPTNSERFSRSAESLRWNAERLPNFDLSLGRNGEGRSRCLERGRSVCRWPLSPFRQRPLLRREAPSSYRRHLSIAPADALGVTWASLGTTAAALALTWASVGEPTDAVAPPNVDLGVPRAPLGESKMAIGAPRATIGAPTEARVEFRASPLTPRESPASTRASLVAPSESLASTRASLVTPRDAIVSFRPRDAATAR